MPLPKPPAPAAGPTWLGTAKRLGALPALILASLVLAPLLLAPVSQTAHAEPRHGIAMHGEPRLPPDFKALGYTNPAAPKGGRLTLAINGAFDSLNPLIYKGEIASGVRGYVYESLMARGEDEPFSLYGLIAASIDVPDDRRSITFQLRPEARFADGKAITADDVLFSYKLLAEKGLPAQRGSYRKIAAAEARGPHIVHIAFKPEADGSFDREMPLILGLMPVLPSHKINPETFEQTSLEPPLGSGPYTITRVDPGRSITFTKRLDWWAKDLAITRGRFNFDEIRHEYFRDASALFEAFKSGEIDSYVEADPSRWATGYGFPAVEDGRVVKREIASRLPAGMSGLVFNTRRPVFADQRVRQALELLFDFDWINRNLFGGLYKRTQSFFERSELSSFGLPADARERALLASFPDAVRADILDGTAKLPVTDGSGNNRANQQAAVKLLTAAGYKLDGRRMVHTATGKQLAFEVLATSRAQERLVLTYQRALEPLGIALTLRQTDSAQYEARLKDGSFDMIQTYWASSLSPGNEQVNRWGSRSADQTGARNYAGIKNPAVDAMIQAILAARGAEEFRSAVRALDRVLRSGTYVIPLYHLPNVWVAHKATLKGPEKAPNGGFDLDTYWLAK
jgi:peptide/nickel transport system substrate-binding protein